VRKEVKDFVRTAEDYGFVCVGLNGSSHWTLRHKSGVKVTVACSPSKGRWQQNALAQIRRIHRQQQLIKGKS
jgi:predicted RNA binding protein YcfA (HicA-like mRNA interferase family)